MPMTAHRLLAFLAERVLADEARIKCVCANDGPQCQLRLAVQSPTNIELTTENIRFNDLLPEFKYTALSWP